MNKSFSVGLDIGTTKIVAMVGEKNQFNKVNVLGSQSQLDLLEHLSSRINKLDPVVRRRVVARRDHRSDRDTSFAPASKDRKETHPDKSVALFDISI